MATWIQADVLLFDLILSWLTSVPAKQETHSAEKKNNTYFEFKYLKLSLGVLISAVFLYKLYSIATPKYSKPLMLEILRLGLICAYKIITTDSVMFARGIVERSIVLFLRQPA